MTELPFEFGGANLFLSWNLCFRSAPIDGTIVGAWRKGAILLVGCCLTSVERWTSFAWSRNACKIKDARGGPQGPSLHWSSQYIYIYISIYPQKREDPRENRERLPIQRAKEPLSRVFFFLGRRNALQFMGHFCSLMLASRMKWIYSKCWIESLLYYWCTDHGLHWSPGLAPFPLLSIIIRICCGCAVSGSLLILSPIIVRIIYALAAPDSTSSFSPLTTSRWHTAVRKAWKKKKNTL